MSSVTNILVRRSTDVAVGFMRSTETQEPNGGLVALFGLSAIAFCLAFWCVSNTISSPRGPQKLTTLTD
jgi:hypothetical protein